MTIIDSKEEQFPCNHKAKKKKPVKVRFKGEIYTLLACDCCYKILQIFGQLDAKFIVKEHLPKIS